jgi:ParB family chromosome partitioning protein
MGIIAMSLTRREILLLSVGACFLDYRSTFKWQAGHHDVPLMSIRRGKGQRFVNEGIVKELMTSIKKDGILNHLLVRIKDDGSLALLDGLHRWEACRRLKMKTVPCFLRADESIVLESWPKALHRIETDPKTFATQLKKVMKVNGLTKEALAAKLGRSVTWLEEKLRAT